MSELICPFCQQEMESVFQLSGAGGLVEEAYLLCSKCNIRGERKLWQELIRTRKALEIAVDALTRIAVSPETMMEPEKVVPQLADLALEQIKALEQKE